MKSMMAAHMLSSHADRFRLHPVTPRHAQMFCFALLTVSCALASFVLACATPFAVVAAATRPLRFALLVAACEIVRRLDPFGRGRAMSA